MFAQICSRLGRIPLIRHRRTIALNQESLRAVQRSLWNG